MSQVTQNTQINTINVLNETINVQENDLFLLQRNNLSFKVKKQNLNIINDDEISLQTTWSSQKHKNSFHTNKNTLDHSYILDNNLNGMAVGDLTILEGVTLEITQNSTFAII